MKMINLGENALYEMKNNEKFFGYRRVTDFFQSEDTTLCWKFPGYGIVTRTINSDSDFPYRFGIEK